MKDQTDEIKLGVYPTIPKQIRAQKKRQALLNSGSYLFVEQGYEQTTAKEIAAHAGVATGTFYRYFSDKHQLLLSLLKDQLETLMPPPPDWNHRDPEAILSQLLKEHVDRLNKLGLHRVLPEMIHRDKELASSLLEARRKIFKQILEGLKHVKEIGNTWDDLHLETLSWSIMALVEKIPEMQQASGGQLDYDKLAQIIVRLVFPPDYLKTLK